jgi:hypothetical protein
MDVTQVERDQILGVPAPGHARRIGRSRSRLRVEQSLS